MPPPDWKSAIEVHPPGWECPAEPFWIAGWITSVSGLVPIDLRATLGARVFLGLCGMPRADKEIEARGQAGPPHAGFCFLLNPVAGARELTIEVCDQHGRWTPILRQAVISPAGATSPAPAAATTASTDTGTFLRILQTVASRPRSSWKDLAREVLTAADAVPLDVLPSPPFHGALEEMSFDAPVQYNRLLVTGWIAHRTQPITALTAFLDTGRPLPLVHGLSRPDAAKLFVDLVEGATSRFAGHLELPPGRPLPLALRIFADLDDGRRELVFAKRIRPLIVSGADPELPPFSALTFVRAVWALRQAGGLPAPLFPWLRTAWCEFRTAAPVMLPPSSPADDPPPQESRPLSILLVTHNLNLEGAPLIAFEFARHLATQPGWRVRVVAPEDGPLRARYAEAGLNVELVDVRPALVTKTTEDFHAALAQLAAQLDLDSVDLVAANTMVVFWAVLIAHRLHKPSILYTHESVSVRRFFAPHLAPPLIAEAETAFAQATRVVFSATASQKVHGRIARRDHFRVMPGWIDVAGIQAYTAAHPRADLRQKLGLPTDAIVFANIGSISVRKGQQVFLEAVERLLEIRPATAKPPLVFLMVGAKPGPDPYLDILRHRIAHRPLPQVHIIEQVPDPYAYFQAADIFVCSSYEEAFPRVVMEAAVFGRSIVSTDVNGIPEMLGPEDAWLMPPGDPDRMAAAMLSALTAHLAGDTTRAERGQRAVCERFDAAILLPRHTRLLAAVAGMSMT